MTNKNMLHILPYLLEMESSSVDMDTSFRSDLAPEIIMKLGESVIWENETIKRRRNLEQFITNYRKQGQVR